MEGLLRLRIYDVIKGGKKNIFIPFFAAPLQTISDNIQRVRNLIIKTKIRKEWERGDDKNSSTCYVFRHIFFHSLCRRK